MSHFYPIMNVTFYFTFVYKSLILAIASIILQIDVLSVTAAKNFSTNNVRETEKRFEGRFN